MDKTIPAGNHSLLRGQPQPELIRAEILADLFESTAQRIPDKIALSCGQHTLTYRELDKLADRVAAHLIASGIKPGHILGLWLPRGIDLLVMQLGIAKTGAAWLPFDTETPVDRIKVCMADADASGLLSCAANADALADLTCPVWTSEALKHSPASPALRRSGGLPGDPAYIIYTSGSTGKPKGILINQGAICHFLRSENSILGIREDDRVYQGFSVAFDMSFEEIWISYLVGATLWIAPREVSADPEALPLALMSKRLAFSTPSPLCLHYLSATFPICA